MPNSVINPVGGTFSSLTRFGVTIQAKAKSGGKTVDYISTTARPGGKLTLGAKTVFATKSEFPLLPASLTSPVATQSAGTKILYTR